MVLAQKYMKTSGNQDMNPTIYAHLIFDKGAKTYNGEKTASSTNVAGKSDYLPAKN
jgi:hypothetical protein